MSIRPLPIVLLTLGACQPAPDPSMQQTAVGQVPPPQQMTLTSLDHAFPGEAVTFELFGALPGRTVQLGASSATTGGHPCPPILAGACVDLHSPALMIATATSDEAGHAIFRLTLPPTLPPREVHLQALSAQPTGVGALSNAVTLTVLSPGGDADGDHLTNHDEQMLYGTHPLRADTDRGGVDDDEEITLALDPLDADDDLDAPPASPLPGDLVSALSAGEQTMPAASRGDGSTLVVWQDSRAGASGSPQWGSAPLDIFAARVDDAGQLLDATPIVVAQGVMDQVWPDVAWNGDQWLITWTSRGPWQEYGATRGIHAARVAPDGTVVDTDPIRVWDDPLYDDAAPAVASDGDGWAIVWRGGLGFGVEGVLGATVSATGDVTAARLLYRTSGGVGFYVPYGVDLAFAGGRYLLVGTHLPVGGGGGDEVFGLMMDPTLRPLAPEQQLTASGSDKSAARVASNGSAFFVSWFDEAMWGQVAGTPMLPTGQVAVPGGTVLESGMYGSLPGTAVAWDGSGWVVAWDPGAALHLAGVSPAGQLLPGSPFSVGSGTWAMRAPALAGGPSGVLAVWGDARAYTPSGLGSTDLFGARVDAAGHLGPELALSVSPPAQSHPDIAGSIPDGWLVAFVSETTDERRLMVQRLHGDGTPRDPEPTALVSSDTWLTRPAVAFDGDRWLVAWEESGQVWFRRVGLDGLPIEPAPVLLLDGYSPDIAAVQGDFLVVASTPGFPSWEFLDIRGRRVRGSDGALLDASSILLAAGYNQAPAVGAYDDRWLVAWQSHASHDESASTVWARFVDRAGLPGTPFVGGQTSTYNRAPSIATDGGAGLVTWTANHEVYGRRVLRDGTVLDTDAGFPLTAAAGDQYNPDVAWDGLAWRVAWTDARVEASALDYAGLGDVYTTGVSTSGLLDAPQGMAVAADPARTEVMPAVAGDGGQAIITATAMEARPPYGTLRVSVRPVP